MYEIVVGRSASDYKKLGLKGTVFLGKHYVKMGAETSLSNSVYMDVARSHVVLVAGKRGSGKSYSLGVIAEEVSDLDPEVKEKIAILIFDTMGIYWTMKHKNAKDEELLSKWGIATKALDISLYTPSGYVAEQKQAGVPVDYSFTINPAELDSSDWCGVFGVSLFSDIGVGVDRAVRAVAEANDSYSLSDLVTFVRNDAKLSPTVELAVENRFLAAESWGIFSSSGTPLVDLVTGGKVTVLDISCYHDWNIKCLVVGLITRKLMQQRMSQRKAEELADVERGHSYFGSTTEMGSEMPLVWLFIDEAHEFLPLEGKTPATGALVQVLREGRQPGVSLVMATQQPGEIHKDVITQTDLVLSHRITAKRDIAALNAMMHNYLSGDIEKFLNMLPREKGAAIILDDTAEKMYPIQVHPRKTWHGGEAPAAVKAKGSAYEKLGF